MAEYVTKFYVQRIAILCVLTNKTQSELANELGISKQGLSHYISGKRKINEIIIDGICRYFGVPKQIFTDDRVFIVLDGENLKILT